MLGSQEMLMIKVPYPLSNNSIYLNWLKILSC